VVLAVRREEATPSRAGGDPCRELEEFAARFKTSSSCD
jgi:hypothetical protein